ncbi:hypothetical protein, partial [Streptomyces sp. SID7804]|uniref:hypothetical protein n=1 Tax=Streptomyces sp. SID7804 TaxID=2690327 RepID=UPI0031F634DF
RRRVANEWHKAIGPGRTARDGSVVSAGHAPHGGPSPLEQAVGRRLPGDLGRPADSAPQRTRCSTSAASRRPGARKLHALLFMGVAEAIGSYGFGIRVVPPKAAAG